MRPAAKGPLRKAFRLACKGEPGGTGRGRRSAQQEAMMAALGDDLMQLADGDMARVDRIIKLLERDQTWRDAAALPCGRE